MYRVRTAAVLVAWLCYHARALRSPSRPRLVRMTEGFRIHQTIKMRPVP